MVRRPHAGSHDAICIMILVYYYAETEEINLRISELERSCVRQIASCQPTLR